MLDISSTLNSTNKQIGPRVLYQAVPTPEVGYRDKQIYAGLVLVKITTDDQYDPIYEEISAVGDVDRIIFETDVIEPYSIYEPHITNERRDWETNDVIDYVIVLRETVVLDSDTNVNIRVQFPLNNFRMLATELSGVIMDVELGSTGFDEVCLNTIKRVEIELNKLARSRSNG